LSHGKTKWRKKSAKKNQNNNKNKNKNKNKPTNKQTKIPKNKNIKNFKIEKQIIIV
jgi:hypothetical protein